MSVCACVSVCVCGGVNAGEREKGGNRGRRKERR